MNTEPISTLLGSNQMLRNLLTCEYLALFVLPFIASIIGTTIGSYLKRRAENLATQHDIEKLTNTIETIKSDFAKDLEVLKVRLQSSLHANNLFMNKQTELASNLWDSMVIAQKAAFEIQALVNFGWTIHGFGDRLDSLFNAWETTMNNFRHNQEIAIPFLSQDVLILIQTFDSQHTEVVKTIVKTIGECDQKHYSHEVAMQILEENWKTLRKTFITSGKSLFEKLKTLNT